MSERKPNILIFMTDQQRADTAPPFGRAITPNLDRFSKEAVAFTRANCPSPHCCPSRATFFTGLYPSQHGVWNNVEVGNALSRGVFDGVRMWSEELKEAGYRLDFFGKWHVSTVESPEHRGWNLGRAICANVKYQHRLESEPVTYEWEPYRQIAAEMDSASDPERDPEPGSITREPAHILRPGYRKYVHYGVQDEARNKDRQMLEDALATIRTRAKEEPGRPWCQYIGTIGPHDPYFVPQAYLDLYDPDEIELPENFADRMEDKPALYRRTRGVFDQLTEAEHKEAIRHYLAYCTYEDALFGRVLQTLEETGELDDTVVIYLSDHGDYAAEHGLWCKGLPCFQSAYHVPALVRWPKGIRNPGRTVDAFVNLADFAPTLLEIAGLDVREYERRQGRPLAGRSLVPFLRDEEVTGWRDAHFTQSNGNELYGIQRSVMTREWKYVYNGFDFDELYDLQSDPHETRNLAGDPRYRDVIRMLARRMWRFAYEHEDVCINPYIMVGLAPVGPAEAFRQ